jgi:hypothetical protein
MYQEMTKTNSLNNHKMLLKIYLTTSDFNIDDELQNPNILEKKLALLTTTSIETLRNKQVEEQKKIETIKKSLIQRQILDTAKSYYTEEELEKQVAKIYTDYQRLLENLSALSAPHLINKPNIKEEYSILQADIKEFEHTYRFDQDQELEESIERKLSIENDLLTLQKNKNITPRLDYYKKNDQLVLNGVCRDLVFQDVDFSKMDLSGIDFNRCKFNNCRFGNIIKKANFRECKVINATGTLKFEDSDVSFLNVQDSDLNLQITGGKTDQLNISSKGSTIISDANCEGMQYTGADEAKLSLTNVDWNNGKASGTILDLRLNNVRVNQNTDFISIHVKNLEDQGIKHNGELKKLSTIQAAQSKEVEYWNDKIQAYTDQAVKKNKTERSRKFRANFRLIFGCIGIAVGVGLAVAGFPFSLPIVGAIALAYGIVGGAGFGYVIGRVLGDRIGALTAKSDTLVKNKSFQNVVNGITSIAKTFNQLIGKPTKEADQDLFTDYHDPVRHLNQLHNYITPNAESQEHEFKISSVEDLSKIIPHEVAKEIIEDLISNFPESLSNPKLKRLISKDSGVKLGDLLSILPSNDAKLEKKYEEVKPYFVYANLSENQRINQRLVHQAKKIGERTFTIADKEDNSSPNQRREQQRRKSSTQSFTQSLRK